MPCGLGIFLCIICKLKTKNHQLKSVFVAPKFEVAFFQSLDDKELGTVPLILILNEEASECLLTSPFDTDPLEGLLLLLH